MEFNGHADLVYFMHIPKTSGSSLHQFFLQTVGPDQSSPPLLWDHLLTRQYEITDETRFVTGHFGGLFPLWLGRWPRMITMLREPVARALSHVNHIQREETHPLHSLASALSLLEFCQHPTLRQSIDNLQSRYLSSLSFSLALLPRATDSLTNEVFGARSIQFEGALTSLDGECGLQEGALRGLEAMDAFGICDSQEESLRLFSKAFGWNTSNSVTRHHINVAREGQRTLSSLSSSEIDALSELNKVDIKVYERAFYRFSRLCAEQGISFQGKLPKSSLSLRFSA